MLSQYACLQNVEIASPFTARKCSMLFQSKDMNALLHFILTKAIVYKFI